MEGCGLDSSGSEYGPVVSCCECGNEPSGYINVGNFLTRQETISFSAPRSQSVSLSVSLVKTHLKQTEAIFRSNQVCQNNRNEIK
jgi:hypothetical protein